MKNNISRKISLAVLFSSVLLLIAIGVYQLLADSATPLLRSVHKITKLKKEEAQKADLSIKEAMYYRKLPENMVQCGLCPRKCVLKEAQRGFCRVRVNYGGKLYSLVYGKPVSVHVDPIEKKPLYHVLPATSSFSLATAGCNLGCIFCQNWEISQAYPENARHQNLSPEEIINYAIKEKCESIAFTYTEPTIFYEYMLDICKLAKEKGLKTIWVTCGYIEEAPLRELCKYLDAANVDLKGYSENFYKDYTNSSLEPVLRTFKILKQEGIHTELTNLIIPGMNDNKNMIAGMFDWIIINLGTDVPVHLSRFYPHYQLKNKPPTPIKTLLEAKAIGIKKGLNYIYIGNVAGKGLSDMYCPKCKKLLIKRLGYFVEENNIKDGKCKFCGEEIPGIWE